MAEQSRVFISHSAADRADGETAAGVEAHAVRVAIKDALKNDGRFHVLLDEIRLQPGDAWRARINLWLGLCDAAVLILSPAALKSHYVAFEANILGYRWSLDRTFKIIPVLVGVTMDDVTKSPLNPAQVSEWQAAIQGSPDEIAASVLAVVKDLEPSTSRRTYRMAEELESMLAVKKSYLDSAAATLEIDEIPWSLKSDELRLAMRLLGSGMTDACASAIRHFHDDRSFNRAYLSDIAQIIAAAWVDLKAELIHDNTIEPEPKPMLLNASDALTARAYMDAAKHVRASRLRYVMVEAPYVIDEKKGDEVHAQTVIAKVQAALEERYGSAAKVTNELARAKRLKEAVVVAIHEGSLKPGLLDRLRATFDHVTFFVLGGAQPGAVVGDQLLVVTPSLAEKDEDTFLERHAIFTDDVTAV